MKWVLIAVMALTSACALAHAKPRDLHYPRPVRCGVENARPIPLSPDLVLVTTDDGFAILDLHQCPPGHRAMRCYTFPECKRA